MTLGGRLSLLASFFVFFRSGAPLGALLGGFWLHLGAIWGHLGMIFPRFFDNFLDFDGFWGLQWMDSWINQKWTQSSQNNPARRNARLNPPPRLAGHGVLDSSSVLVLPVLVLLARVCQVLPGLAGSFPPPKSSPAGSNIPPGLPAPRSFIVLFFASFF